MKIPVYIVTTCNGTNKDRLIHFFTQNKLFILVKHFKKDCCLEDDQILMALEHCRKHYKCNYCLIIKDNTVTFSSPDKVAEVIKKGIKLNNSCCKSFSSDSSSSSDSNSSSDSCCKSSSSSDSCSSSSDSCYTDSSCYTSSSNTSFYNKSISNSDNNKQNKKCNKKCKWDLFYLCKWLDRCDLYKTCSKMKTGTKIVKTESPFGLQAIVYSPKGRDIILGEKRMKNCDYFNNDFAIVSLDDTINFNIEEGLLEAVATSPNLFQFDLMSSTNTLDLLKLSECRLPDIEEEEDDGPLPGIIPFVWFVAIVLGIILLAWIFYQGIAKYEVVDASKDITRIQRK